MNVSASESSNTPLYLQLARDLEEQIQSGHLQPGYRLPSFGRMRREHGVALNTVERVYSNLEKKGLVRREAKRGIFVAEPIAPARPVVEVIAHCNHPKNIYYSELLRGVQEEAHRQGCEILLRYESSSCEWDRLDGVVTLAPDDQLMQALPPHMPCVATMLHRYGNFATVCADDAAGITAVMEHLFGLGHRRIAFFTLGCWRDADRASKLRLEAYYSAMAKAGITPDPRWVRSPLDSGLEVPVKNIDLGRTKMKRWLDDNWSELGCTALMMQNDEMAIGAMESLHDAGLRLPQDVSVVGFDGIEFGTFVRPGLTSVSVPLVEVGATAVAMVLEQIHKARRAKGKKVAAPKSEVLPVRLIVRDSTASVSG